MIQIADTRKNYLFNDIFQPFFSSFEMPREAASDRDRATVSNFVNYHANKCVTRRDGVNFNAAAVFYTQIFW